MQAAETVSSLSKNSCKWQLTSRVRQVKTSYDSIRSMLPQISGLPMNRRLLSIDIRGVKNSSVRWKCICLIFIGIPLSVLAQKVRTGYDKSADFTKFKTYCWNAPEMPVTRPLLYASVIGWIDMDLKAKGLTKVEKDGDLSLIPAGGMEFGVNMAAGTPILPTYGVQPAYIDATRWTGSAGAAYTAAGPYVPEGTFALTFVDRQSNKIVWNGTVKEKLDIENKVKSADRVQKAIAKLMKKFPPGRD